MKNISLKTKIGNQVYDGVIGKSPFSNPIGYKQYEGPLPQFLNDKNLLRIYKDTLFIHTSMFIINFQNKQWNFSHEKIVFFNGMVTKLRYNYLFSRWIKKKLVSDYLIHSFLYYQQNISAISDNE